MNTKIYTWLKSDKSFAEGVKLYHEFGHNMAFKHLLNAQGENEITKAQLMYELQQLSGLDEAEFNHYLKAATEEKKNVVIPEIVTIATLPEEIVKTIKLRQEFPFLNDANCPDELKILVADRIKAYHTYVNAHQELFDATNDEELQAVAETVVENYLENQQIWNELNHYKETGEILGENNIFDWVKREAEIRAMQTGELAKLREGLKNNISRTKKLIKDEPTHKNTMEREVSVKQMTKELTLVNQLLGIKEDAKKGKK